MSNRRVRQDRGWIFDSSRLPRGPGGRAMCRQCGLEVGRGRRTFCSDECVERWKVTTQPGWVRRLLLDRDHGVCAVCRLDTVALAEELSLLEWGARSTRLRTLGIPGWRRNLWDADHIVPVVEGGGECGLDGYRTLCIACHRHVTRELRGRLAARIQG